MSTLPTGRFWAWRLSQQPNATILLHDMEPTRLVTAGFAHWMTVNNGKCAHPIPDWIFERAFGFLPEKPGEALLLDGSDWCDHCVCGCVLPIGSAWAQCPECKGNYHVGEGEGHYHARVVTRETLEEVK